MGTAGNAIGSLPGTSCGQSRRVRREQQRTCHQAATEVTCASLQQQPAPLHSQASTADCVSPRPGDAAVHTTPVAPASVLSACWPILTCEILDWATRVAPILCFHDPGRSGLAWAARTGRASKPSSSPSWASRSSSHIPFSSASSSSCVRNKTPWLAPPHAHGAYLLPASPLPAAATTLCSLLHRSTSQLMHVF